MPFSDTDFKRPPAGSLDLDHIALAILLNGFIGYGSGRQCVASPGKE
jgi:hypothetical protein